VTNIGYRVSKTGTYADLVKNPVLANGQTWSGWRYATPDRTILWFNVNGYLVKISDRNGNDITYSYVGYGGMNVTQITDNASGRSLTLTYDASNHVASVSTPSVAANGGALAWNYSYTGNFLSQVCPPTSAGVSGCINYDYQNDRLIRIRKPKGNTDVEVTYDTNAFTSAATNLLAPGSFEDAGTSGWYVAGSPAGSANTGSASAPFGSKVLSMPVDAAGYTFPYSPRTDVQGNTTYTLSGLVSGPAGGVP
jgi:hypothetical protein